MKYQLINLLTFYCFVQNNIIHADLVYSLPLQEFIQAFPETTYIQCTKNFTSTYNKPFPLYPEFINTHFPTTMNFADIFIINIPQGYAYFDKTNYVYINHCFIQETQIKDINFFDGRSNLFVSIPSKCFKIPGRVAIISHLYPNCYGLWFFDVLAQLALLEIHNIEYDYLIIPYYENFMQESLDLWGIDRDKIIPWQTDAHIQADYIILPTATSQVLQHAYCTNYYINFLLKYVREKLLAGVAKLSLDKQFPEKIFISRKDANGKRATPNEDDIFALFEPLGFKQYSLTSLSVAEKIALFHNAKTIISFVGSGSTSIIFCKPGTLYIDIIQKMVEASYFFISEIFNLNYLCINASTEYDVQFGGPWSPSEAIPIECIQEFVQEHIDTLSKT